MVNHQPFPLSMFESVQNPNVTFVEDVTFDDFTQIMIGFAEDEFRSKNSAPLYSSTRFSNNKRSKANATQSGLIVLDIDDGQSIENTLAIVDDLEITALLYSTASHRHEHHKFRLCIPLMEPVEYDQHVQCWHALNHIFVEGQSDGSKVGCESLFYVPGQYPDAPSVFEHRDATIIPASDWVTIAGLPDNPKASTNYVGSSSPPSTSRSQSSWSKQRPASADDLDIYETKLISEDALNKYTSAYGDWHHARFGLMMSIVGRARRMSIAVSSQDLVHLFNQVDVMDGAHYQSPDYQKEIANDAAKAMSQAA